MNKTTMQKTNGVLSNLFKTKNLDELLAESKKANLKKNLTAVDLIILGVGAIIGSGIFTVVGIAAVGDVAKGTPGAGPALMISMIIAALACIFAALCYSEFASMIPVSGSAYTYTFATMGEFAAWSIGWILILNYAIGYIAVASAWTGYLIEFLRGFSHILPTWIKSIPVWLYTDYTTLVNSVGKEEIANTVPMLFNSIPVCFNLPGILMTILVASILIKGTKESTKMTGILVAIKLIVIFLFVAIGAFYIQPANWVPFAPHGGKGIFLGAFLIFFAYIGFDAIATTAEETKNPQKDLPIGIIGSLLICTVIYVLVALVLTGMTPIGSIDVAAPIASVMRTVGQGWVAGLISIGALTGLTSVLIVLYFASTRVLFAMARDNLVPSMMKKVHPKYQTPHVITAIMAIVIIIASLFLDINLATQLCNFGTLTAFTIVCIAVLLLRHTDPNRERPFKVPFSPVTPTLGILACSGLILYSIVQCRTAALLFPLWLVLGCFIYATYGYPKNRRLETQSITSNEELKEKTVEEKVEV